jgi:hypothetical protein
MERHEHVVTFVLSSCFTTFSRRGESSSSPSQPTNITTRTTPTSPHNSHEGNSRSPEWRLADDAAALGGVIGEDHQGLEAHIRQLLQRLLLGRAVRLGQLSWEVEAGISISC